MLTSRERVLCALNHEEPDRVPIFFGTSGATTMLADGYEKLKAHLGINEPTAIFSRNMQYVLMDEEVLTWSGSDGRPLLPAAAPAPLAHDVSEDAYVDGWGSLWERRPGDLYYEAVDSPLRRACIDDLDRYPWPALGDPGRFAGLREKAQSIQKAGYAVVALSGIDPWEQAYISRGVENALFDLAGNPDLIVALMSKITEQMKAGVIGLLEEAGEYIDVLIT